MFCPKCGKADQAPETYCRQCGVFLPDISKPVKVRHPPEEHVRANTVLSIMTIVASFTLAILLWSMLAFRENTHPLIYVTAGLLFAMGIWHIQTLWRILQLKKHLKKVDGRRDLQIDGVGTKTDQLLEPADFENMQPASVTDHTTKHLSDTKLRSTESKH